MRNAHLLSRPAGLLLTALMFAAYPASASLALAQSRVLDTIAFGSCARLDQPQPVWDQILAHAPDLFIGDNVYADTEDMGEMRTKYEQLGAKPGFQKLRAAMPVLATWDDHDYGVNDGGTDYPMKEAAQMEFARFVQVPDSSPVHTWPGVYDAYTYGPEEQRVQVILLDTRYFRSPLEPIPEGEDAPWGPYRPAGDPDKTMLGEPTADRPFHICRL